MPFLSKTGHDKILRRIMETGGLTEDMEKDIERLRADFDEREGMLKRYGETYDGEDKDEYDYIPREDLEVTEEEKIDWEAHYNEMKDRYMKRFFGTSEVKKEVEDVMKSQEKDIKRDGKKQGYEELFEEREGD